MINVVGRAGSLASLVKVTNQAAATATVPVVNSGKSLKKAKISAPPAPKNLTGYTLAKNLPSGNVRVTQGPAGMGSLLGV